MSSEGPGMGILLAPVLSEVVMKHVLTLIAAALLLAGCGSNQGDFNEVTHTWSSNQGTFAVDHVSSRRIDTSKAVKRSYLGETYYFESEENARKFDSNPWAYLYDHNNPEDSGTLG